MELTLPECVRVNAELQKAAKEHDAIRLIDILGTLRASDCGSFGGCNFCAPSCFNEAYDVDVFDPEGAYVGSVTWVWPGCACGGDVDRSHIVLRFPKGASAEKRAALVGGVMLIEYTHMELKRMQEGNSASASGGGNADRYQAQSKPASAGPPQGAPDVEQMER